MHTATEIELPPSADNGLLTPPIVQCSKELSGQNRDRTNTTSIWGLRFCALSFEQALDSIHSLIQQRRPSWFVTANLQYVMLSHHVPGLKAISDGAALILADGMPIVWRSRLTHQPLPERIAGSDLIYGMAALAGKHGYRMFFLGGAEGVADQAARQLQSMYPEMVIAGVESPPFRPLLPHEEADLAVRIREARPDMLVVALGQPGGEQWIARWHQQMEVPVSVQLGGSFNFVTGRIRRSPRWVGAIGMEWAHRLWCEPRRLGPRYLKNIVFLGRLLLRDVGSSMKGRLARLLKPGAADGRCHSKGPAASCAEQEQQHAVSTKTD